MQEAVELPSGLDPSNTLAYCLLDFTISHMVGLVFFMYELLDLLKQFMQKLFCCQFLTCIIIILAITLAIQCISIMLCGKYSQFFF